MSDEEAELFLNVRYSDINRIRNYYGKQIEELQKENAELRDWKYVIDTPLDLDRLKELDIIKIKGKEYISKNIYDELLKDKEALIRNYDKVLKLIDKE